MPTLHQALIDVTDFGLSQWSNKKKEAQQVIDKEYEACWLGSS